MSNNVIAGAFWASLEGIAIYFGLASNLPTQGGITIFTEYVKDKLNQNQYVYVKTRIGLSYNSYLRYYEYVESIIYYNDSSFSQAIEVIYNPTGMKANDEVLSRYGLQNP